jgi:hypothetical protein
MPHATSATPCAHSRTHTLHTHCTLYTSTHCYSVNSRITPPYVVHELHSVPHLHGDFAHAPAPYKLQLERDPVYGEQDGGTDIYPDPVTGLWHIFQNAGKTELFVLSLLH